jgi:hypothetical protein
MTIAARASDFSLDRATISRLAVIPFAAEQRATKAVSGQDPALSTKHWGVFPKCYTGSVRDPALAV